MTLLTVVLLTGCTVAFLFVLTQAYRQEMERAKRRQEHAEKMSELEISRKCLHEKMDAYDRGFHDGWEEAMKRKKGEKNDGEGERRLH